MMTERDRGQGLRAKMPLTTQSTLLKVNTANKHMKIMWDEPEEMTTTEHCP